MSNNEVFFDSILSHRYLRPKLIDNDFLDKIKKSYNKQNNIKIDELVELNSNSIKSNIIEESYYNKIYNYLYEIWCYHNIKILLLLLFCLFLYYRYHIAQEEKINDRLLIEEIDKEYKKNQLLKKKELLESLLKTNNMTNINNINNIDNTNNIKKKIQKENKILFNDDLMASNIYDNNYDFI